MLSKTILFCFVLFTILFFGRSKIYYLDDALKISSDLASNYIAYADFEDNLNKTGWLNLKIYTNNNFSDTLQMYAAGYLEGYLTQEYIYDAYYNFVNSVLEGNENISGEAQKFVEDQLKWINQQIIYNNNSSYWKFVSDLLGQLKGMHEGYHFKVSESQRINESIDFFHFYYLTNMGDLEDIIPAFSSFRMKDPQFKECTGFIKLDKDLITSHNTHNIYSLMLRIFKTYNFDLHNPEIKNKILSYSARPGDLESKDDFYVVGQNLVVIESSLNNYNKTLYEFIKADSLPVWIRVNIANRLAESSKEWVDLFELYNSGTHNNQWAVVDYGLYWDYLKKGTLNTNWTDVVWLIEQFFFLTLKMDVTQNYLLNKTFFATYNFPYHKEIFDIGDYETYDPHDPREDIINENQGNVHDVEDIKKLIILNSNQTGNPCVGIAPRCDLLENSPNAFGAIDGKVISGEMLLNNTAWIYSSPSHDDLTPFSFQNFEKVAHKGIPEIMNFNWTLVKLE